MFKNSQTNDLVDETIVRDEHLEKTNNTGLISIIIPVYNAEPYIENLLNSLFQQTYSRFEIIIAYDEKSNDGTLPLIQRIAKTHPMVIDIAIDSSVGAARNRGLRLASGEFVVFVDADDEVLPDYLEVLHHIFELHPELDVACCNALSVKYNDNIKTCKELAKNTVANIVTLERDEALIAWIHKDLVIERAAWSYLARKQYLIEKNIYFPNYSMAEDQIWVAHAIGETKFIGYISKPLYLYIQNSSSLCNKYRNLEQRKKQIQSSITTRELLMDYFSEISPKVYDAFRISDGRVMIKWATVLYPYEKWIGYLDKYNLIDERYDVQGIIPSAEKYLFKGNKRLFHMCIRTTFGLLPETPLEKFIGVGYRVLSSLYHVIAPRK